MEKNEYTPMFVSNGYGFSFQHHTADKHRFTLCVVTKDGKVVLSGTAFCNPKDQFKRATGRKIALTSALKLLGFTQEERRVAWEEYFKATGN